MSKPKIEKTGDAQPFKVGRKKYLKLGEIVLDTSSGQDFVKLADVKSLIPRTMKQDEVYIVGNRKGVCVYQRLP